MPALDAPYLSEHRQWRRDHNENGLSHPGRFVAIECEAMETTGVPALDWPSDLFVDAMAGDFQIGGKVETNDGLPASGHGSVRSKPLSRAFDEPGPEVAIWYGGLSRGNTHAGMTP
jgi:hypothetical protein